ncbi:MAG TPA: DNA ligase D [Polyangiaceae bacterium]|nr:DNA ligase D [Polyangiaceae bacterium]
MRALKKYQEMRDFSRTAEPRGPADEKGGAKLRKTQTALTYVIQKHAARRLHYDFRLELDGVLLSWAVPKGPSFDPRVKRLAVETEPHPIEYAQFEGGIPKGEYGGGTVMVWDRGSWTPEGDARAGYKKGHLRFTLEGEKLHGAWHLVRTARPNSKDKNWLLFKSTDDRHGEERDSTPDVVLSAPNSVLSGRSLEQIAKDVESGRTSAPEQPVQQTGLDSSGDSKESNRKPRRAKRSASVENLAASEQLVLAGARKEKLPSFVEPQLATLVSDPPDGEEWVHELKFDGYRVLARIDNGDVRLLTRRGLDWTERMPTFARAVRDLAERRSIRTAIFDGEFVALNARGISDFQELQNSLGTEAESLVYYVFDLLHLNGVDLRSVVLTQRKLLLRELLAQEIVPPAAGATPGMEPSPLATASPNPERARLGAKPRGKAKDLESDQHGVRAMIRFSEHMAGSGRAFFERACKLGLEGIISKRAVATYHSGRGRDWLKTKCLARQEFVIVGYTEPSGSRTHLGALLLGVRKEDELVYCGRVGTGFNAQSLAELHERLAPLAIAKPLRLGGVPKGAEARGVHWVRPELVAEVAFTGFTQDGALRHPAFQGLRDDKLAGEVGLERPRPTRDLLSNPATKKKSGERKSKKANSAGTNQPEPDAHRIAEGYPLSNADKILYPEQGITKRELLDYYALVAERMLPHVANRPLTLVRCPNGRGKACFFQKHPGPAVPEGLRSVAIREQEGKAPCSVIDDALGLFGLVQLGALEIHTWGSRADDFEHADLLVFDIDPDPALDFSAVIRCAHRLRQLFESAKLESFVKTTGGKGLHVCVPIEPKLEWDQIKAFTGSVAEALSKESPDLYVATVSKAKRQGKIFIDYLRNARGATFVAPYSTRARENAPVAVPLEWDELTPKFTPSTFTVRTLAKRLKHMARDPFERLISVQQRLPID